MSSTLKSSKRMERAERTESRSRILESLYPYPDTDYSVNSGGSDMDDEEGGDEDDDDDSDDDKLDGEEGEDGDGDGDGEGIGDDDFDDDEEGDDEDDDDCDDDNDEYPETAMRETDEDKKEEIVSSPLGLTLAVPLVEAPKLLWPNYPLLLKVNATF